MVFSDGSFTTMSQEANLLLVPTIKEGGGLSWLSKAVRFVILKQRIEAETTKSCKQCHAL